MTAAKPEEGLSLVEKWKKNVLRQRQKRQQAGIRSPLVPMSLNRTTGGVLASQDPIARAKFYIAQTQTTTTRAAQQTTANPRSRNRSQNSSRNQSRNQSPEQRVVAKCRKSQSPRRADRKMTEPTEAVKVKQPTEAVKVEQPTEAVKAQEPTQKDEKESFSSFRRGSSRDSPRRSRSVSRGRSM